MDTIATNSTRCSQCLLPKDMVGIVFDNDESCSLCNAANANSRASVQQIDCIKDDIEERIQEIRKRGVGRRYDCVVGISGGRDSTYLLSLLVNKHHLRCLAAYYRTPFTPEGIDNNVRRLITHLDVPLVEMNISQDYHLLIAQQVVRLWMKNPYPAIANLACGVCKFVNREVYRIAKNERVSSIVFGGNRFESFQFSAAQHETTDNNTLTGNIQKMYRLLVSGISTLKQSSGLWQYLSIGVKSSILYISPHTPWLRFRYPSIKTIDYFFHTEWDEEEAEKLLREVGWELPPNANSTWRADCTFNELKNYMFKKMIGCSYADAYFANMVRAGYLTRKAGLHRLEREGKLSIERFEDACNALKIDPLLFQTGSDGAA